MNGSDLEVAKPAVVQRWLRLPHLRDLHMNPRRCARLPWGGSHSPSSWSMTAEMLFSLRTSGQRKTVFRYGLHFQQRISATKRIGHVALRQRIRYPSAVYHQAILVVSRRQIGFFQPVTISQELHQPGRGMPVVERASNGHGCRRRIGKLKANAPQIRADARVIEILSCVLHEGVIKPLCGYA